MGANVVEKGTTNGTITDVDGRFSLEVYSKGTLLVSYIGFTSA
ncbi:MAG: carboxypeptidase-like regulatory domain-containing protein [Parabacteroides merdae]